MAIASEDPRTPDVRALLERHLRFSHEVTPEGHVHVEHLVATARARGYDRVSLETGTYDAFAPARALYVAAGFVTCAPFGEYTDNPHSVCMTLLLADARLRRST